MFSASQGRWLLTTVALVSAACIDIPLPRGRESALADSLADSASLAKTTSRPPSRSSERIDATSENAILAEIRRTLRRLVVAEETFFAENGTYTDELSVIRVTPGRDITIRFLWLSREGWAASGTHSALADKDCVIFAGLAKAPPTTLKYVRSGAVGVPVCDDRAAPPKVTVASPTPSRPRQPEAASALDVLDPRVVMKVDLRNLAHSQETYLAMQGVYARRAEPMALQYIWHRDVRVKILDADAQSWTAKATHAKFPGKSCVIWFGAVSQRPVTDSQRRQSNRAGVPVCDD
jgi:hypothetical protein